MTAFPSLTPTSRRITQGQYPVKRFVSIAGTGVTRAYGSKPFDSSIDLEFSNVPDSDALLIANAYDSARGSTGAVELPDEVWAGMDESLFSKLKGDYIWRFSQQPIVTSVTPGRSSISVKLDGQRDG
jgi:hypothetical protein